MSPCSAPGCRCITPCILWCGPDHDDTDTDCDDTLWDGMDEVFGELDALTRSALADSLLGMLALGLSEPVGSEPTSTATALPTDDGTVGSDRVGSRR